MRLKLSQASALAVGVAAIVCGCHREAQEIAWREKAFTDLCELQRRIVLPAGDGEHYPSWIRRIVLLSDGGFLILESKEARIFRYDSLGVFRKVLGGRGDGPGEFRFPQDVAVMDDSTFLVVDGSQQRVTIIDSSGAYRSAFQTPRLAGKRVVAIDETAIAVSGIYDEGGASRLLAVYGRHGEFRQSFVRAPALLGTLNPSLDDAFLSVSSDHTLMLGSAFVPIVWYVEGPSIRKVPLLPPPPSWVQIKPLKEAAKTTQELRAWTSAASWITRDGFLDESTAVLAWHTAPAGEGTDDLALIGVTALRGTVVTDVPGRVVAVGRGKVWLLEPETREANIVATYECANRMTGDK